MYSVVIKSTIVKFFRNLIFIVGLFAAIVPSSAQPEKYESVFIYQFTRYIEWKDTEGDFIIGIYGDSKIKGLMDAIASSKKVGDTRTIKIKQYNGASSIDKCHILFVPDSRKSDIAAIVSIAKGKGVLIVTESSGLLKEGSCINYILSNDKVSFEISKKNIAAQNLKVSESLIKLAVAVY